MTNIEKIDKLLKELEPKYVLKVLFYAETLKEIQDESEKE